MASSLPNTFRNVVHAFAGFLTVAIHDILYERQIYPRTSFVSVRSYNLAVRQNRHPRVCEWINDAVAAVEAQMLKNAVERVAIVMYNQQNEALERFVFDVSQLPDISEVDLDTTILRDGIDEDAAGLLPTVDMEEHFRAVLSTIATATLRPLPKGCTFTIALELRDDGYHAPLSHPQLWVPAQVETTSSDTSDRSARPQAKTTALRSMKAGELRFEAWVEESVPKDTAPAPQSVSSDDASKLPSAEG